MTWRYHTRRQHEAEGVELTGQWRISFKGRQTSKRIWNDPTDASGAIRLQEQWKESGVPPKKRGGRTKFEVEPVLTQTLSLVANMGDELKKAQEKIKEMEEERRLSSNSLAQARALFEFQKATADKTKPIAKN